VGGVGMGSCAFALGCVSVGSDGAPAYNDAGADTARLDERVGPALSQASVCEAGAFVRRTSRVSASGSTSPRPYEKNKGSTKNIHLVSTLIMHSALKRNNFRRRRDHVEQ
jgi:hypothetical protein